jgi:oligoendopeptidase F
LPWSRSSFVFSNGTGDFNDFLTLIHEMGHCTHNDKMYALPRFQQHNPAELAEIASMSMEYFSLSHIEGYTSQEIQRAKEDKLIEFFSTLSRVALVDAFQHWLYLNPDHTHEHRHTQWIKLYQTYIPSVLDRSGYEKNLAISWHKQLHIFTFPFYYIEYAISELGALGMYHQYLTDPENTLKRYKAFLSA